MAKSGKMSPAAEAALAAQQKLREQRLGQALRQNLRRRKAPAAPAVDPDSADQDAS